jgi:hypothetical protein
MTAAFWSPRDAAMFVTTLSKAVHAAPEWQAAMEALLLVAEGGGPVMFARIGIMRALNRAGKRAARLRKRERRGAKQK